MEIFGHNQLNLFFVPLLKVHNDEFIFKNKNYCWHDVKDVLIWEPFPHLGGVFGTAAAPRATIILADEKKIKIHARVFVKKGEKAKVGFFSCKSDAFDEIITRFRKYIA